MKRETFRRTGFFAKIFIGDVEPREREKSQRDLSIRNHVKLCSLGPTSGRLATDTCVYVCANIIHIILK